MEKGLGRLMADADIATFPADGRRDFRHDLRDLHDDAAHLLIGTLPPAGQPMSAERRAAWTKMAESLLDVLYGPQTPPR